VVVVIVVVDVDDGCEEEKSDQLIQSCSLFPRAGSLLVGI
jgi:hypothetical protein